MSPGRHDRTLSTILEEMESLSRPNGSQTTSATPTSSSSTPAGTCLPRAEAAARNFCRPTFPARASSTSMSCRTARPPRRTCFHRRRSIRQRHGGSGSAARTGSSSTTIRRSEPQPAAGSCFAISARAGSRSSTAGSRMACRRPADRKRRAGAARARFEPHQRHEVVDQVADPVGKPTRRFSTRAARPFRRTASRTRGPESPRAISPARETCLFRRSTMTTARFKPVEELRRAIRWRRHGPVEAVHRQLRFGRHREQPHLRRASARQRQREALRWKLERVGRRSGNAQGDGACLAEDDARRRREARGGFRRPGVARGPCGSRPSSRSTISASTPAAPRPPSAPSGGRTLLPRSPAPSQAAATASSSRSSSGAGPLPNGPTSRSAWRTLASRATASA